MGSVGIKLTSANPPGLRVYSYYAFEVFEMFEAFGISKTRVSNRVSTGTTVRSHEPKPARTPLCSSWSSRRYPSTRVTTPCPTPVTHAMARKMFEIVAKTALVTLVHYGRSYMPSPVDTPAGTMGRTGSFFTARRPRSSRKQACKLNPPKLAIKGFT